MARWWARAAMALALAGLAACAEEQKGAPPQIGSTPNNTLVDEPEPPECPVPLPAGLAGPGLKIASFTIDELGIYTNRQNAALACLLAPFDLVVVQDLAAPPYPGSFINDEPYRPEIAATAFFDAMKAQGFSPIVAPEDTGPGDRLQLNSSLTAWPAFFLKDNRLMLSQDKPSGYIEPDRSANGTYSRVPFALFLTARDGTYDFLMLSLDLSDAGSAQRRRYELSAISTFLQQHDHGERDVFLAGTFDFSSCAEMQGSLPPDFDWLSAVCQASDVSGKHPRDGIAMREGGSAEIAQQLTVIDLVAAMKPFWLYDHGPDYPGQPLNVWQFMQFYASHRPVAVRLIPGGSDLD